MKTLLIKNGKILTFGNNCRLLEDHALYIKDGKTTKIITNESLAKFKQSNTIDHEIDANNKLILPGFINAHMHFYSSFARGLYKTEPSKNFVEILNNLWWKLDKGLTLNDCYYSTMVALVDATKNGTTTLIDHHASPHAISGSLNKVAEALRDGKIKGSLCYELSDRDGAEISKAGIQENIRFIKESRNNPNLHALFGLHASFTLKDQTLDKVKGLINELDTGIHIHCAEDIADQQHSLKHHEMRVVERLEKHGLLNSKGICAHGVHLTDREMKILKKHETILVHNPQSNMNNAVGMANIFKMLDNDLLVGLGTDAMTTNMLEELRSALWAHKLASKDPSCGFMEVLKLLTINNPIIATQLFGRDIGTIKEGADADFAIYDYHSPTPLTEESWAGHLIFGISQSKPCMTISNGEVIMEDGKLLFIDEEKIAFESKKLSQKLWDKF